MNSESFKEASACFGIDCEELADRLYDSTDGQGNVIKTTSPSGYEVKIPELGGTE